MSEPPKPPTGMPFYVVPVEVHEALVKKAYLRRGFSEEEAGHAAAVATNASWHGIRTHNALKALHLDDHMGSMGGSGNGCVPQADIIKIDSPYKAVEKWDCQRKLGQAVAKEAMQRCMDLADEYGVGIVAVDNAFHYLWGGGYVMEAAKKGYIAYTCCTAALAEVVPFMGKTATLGTNPHSWGFPTTDALGYPIVIDWATSVVAMGRVQVLAREGKTLPPDAAVDKDGNPTQDPSKVVALLPFGRHKGYGMCLIDELYSALTGGSLPTIRNRWGKGGEGEKQTCTFYFQCVKADALAVDFCKGRSQADNMKAVLDDILGPGNERCMLPGEIEANGGKLSTKYGGLLFTPKEMEEFAAEAKACDIAFEIESFKQEMLDLDFKLCEK